MTADYERLKIQFRRAGSLPELPGNAVTLISLIDSGEASAQMLEKIILRDPGLASAILRVSNMDMFGASSMSSNTIRSALIRMGQKSVRSIAVSLMIQGIVLKGCQSSFDPWRFSRHSVFTGLLAKYCFYRQQKLDPSETKWTGEEVFAAGVLHDLSLPLLAKISPEKFAGIAMYARRSGLSLEEAFTNVFGGELRELGALAAQTWGLPEVFQKVILYSAEPWDHEEEFNALASVNYAKRVANKNGLAVESWEFPCADVPEVDSIIGLPDEEMAQVLPAIDQLTDKYVPRSKVSAA